MSLTFVNDHGDSYHTNGHGVSLYFTLLQAYGWKPRGTRRPRGYGLFRRWPGYYDSSDGQLVTAGDAKNISEAVRNALADLQREECAQQVVDNITERTTPRVAFALARAFRLSFSKDAFQEFGEFCAKGPFRVT